MSRLEFPSQWAMAAWLAASGIDVTAWARAEAKSLNDLWREYQCGETSFEDDPPARVIEVAQVIIRRGDAVLMELAQTFADGRQRARLRPPSEKLKFGEEPRAAALRCLREELGLDVSEVAIEDEPGAYEEFLDSPSYPGLPTRYRFYTFDAAAAGLPDEDFIRENDTSDDPIRRLLWGWRER